MFEKKTPPYVKNKFLTLFETEMVCKIYKFDTETNLQIWPNIIFYNRFNHRIVFGFRNSLKNDLA